MILLNQENPNSQTKNVNVSFNRLVIAGALIYSYLFYEQNAGINFLLFNLLFIGMLLYRDKHLLQNKIWLFSVAMCLTSSLGILFHSSTLALIANICALLLLSAYSFNTTTSTLFSFLFSGYSVITSFIYVMIDASIRLDVNKQKENNEHKNYRYFTVFIVFLLCILFFVLYQQSNPLFAENTRWVNFDFISFSWLLFTIAGFFMLYGLFHHKTIPGADAWENALPLKSKPANLEREQRYLSELSAGVLLFSFLNLMLVVLNVGDINTIWFKGVLPKGISHSDFVHNGVSLIILSIIIATALIMFLYRNNFQSIKNSGLLKLLVYAWVFQNLVMLFSTACRNQFYIHDYNLTYKRVGVYIWLFLAVIGLIITFIKVWKDQSNWFLIRTNFSVWFCFLVLSSTLNWDILITRYNLNNKPLKEIDFYYLFSLSDSTIPELLKVTTNKNFHLINGELKNSPYSSSYSYKAKTYKHLMKLKINYFLKDYKADWQSWDLRDKYILKSLTN